MIVEKEENREKAPVAQRVKTAMRERPPVNKLDVSVIVIVCSMVVAIVCAFLTEFIFSPEIEWQKVGVDTLIIAACTVSIYLLLRDLAIRIGRRTAPWREAKGRVIGNGNAITEKNIASLAGRYCREWESIRLDEERLRILEIAGISLTDYKEKYGVYDKKELAESFPSLTRKQRELIEKANKVKRLHYDESYIYSVGTVGKRRRAPSSGLHADVVYKLDTLRIIVSTVFTSVMTAAILQEVIFNPSAEAVVECVIKLAVIAFFGAIGMIGGYNLAVIREVDEMNDRADEQERFINWAEDTKILGGKLGAKSDTPEKTGIFDEKTPENGENLCIPAAG